MKEWRLGEKCEHGQLGRQCPFCELKEEAEMELVKLRAESMKLKQLVKDEFDLNIETIDELRAENARLRERMSYLHSLLNWHEVVRMVPETADWFDENGVPK